MALKTFNIDPKAYEEYCKYCKKEGISMSKKIDNFIKTELEKLHSKSSSSSTFKAQSSQSQDSSDHSFSKYC